MVPVSPLGVTTGLGRVIIIKQILKILTIIIFSLLNSYIHISYYVKMRIL